MIIKTTIYIHIYIQYIDIFNKLQNDKTKSLKHQLIIVVCQNIERNKIIWLNKTETKFPKQQIINVIPQSLTKQKKKCITI